MRKSHLDYLRSIIGKAISDRNREQLTDDVLRMKAPVTPVHQMVRDIVCDARFYSVTDNDVFWKTYGAYEIGRFVDSIDDEDWDAGESLTLRKEEFLNGWMASNMLPVSDERRREMEANIQLAMLSGEEGGIPDPEDHDGSSLGIIHIGFGIKDTTNKTGQPLEGLPRNIHAYMQDAPDGNSPDLQAEGHQAELRFLESIHPSIVRLAEKIGRHGGGRAEKKGRFRPSPKSDISGVSVGNVLSSLLPTEIALMASPDSEKIFLDRFARKRLQIFSSASRSIEEGKEKKGPIFICIDTSGSMKGNPEEMAKTLALAVCILAQKEERPVCIFNYSSDISFFVLHSLKTQRRKLLRFLSESYGGGNDENRLMDFIFSRMPRISAYRKFAAELKGADMLVISDFNWVGLEPEKSTLVAKARKKGMRIFSVGVNFFGDIPIQPFASQDDDESDVGYMSGYRFFRKSDFRYRYDDGCIRSQ